MTRRGHMSNGFLNLAEDKNTVYRLKPKDERNYDLWRAKKRPSAAETLERTPPWHFFRDRKQERESIAWNPSRSRHGADDKLHPIVLIILSNFDHNWRRECTRHSESQARGGMTQVLITMVPFSRYSSMSERFINSRKNRRKEAKIVGQGDKERTEKMTKSFVAAE